MLNYITIVLLCLACLYSCKAPSDKHGTSNHAAVRPVAAKQLSRPDSLIASAILSKEDSFSKDGQLINPTVFMSCQVFSAPDSTSRVTDTLAAMTRIKVSDKQSIEYQDTIKNATDSSSYIRNGLINWYSVILPDGRKGFVAAGAVAGYVFDEPQGRFKYLILTDASRFNPYNNVKVLKYDVTRHLIVSTANVYSSGEWECQVRQIKHTPLKGVKMLLHVHVHGDYCGGGESYQLIADAGRNLVLLPESYTSFDDGGGIEDRIAYLPAFDKNGQVALLSNGDAQNTASRTKPVMSAPAGFDTGTDQLLVTYGENGSYATDKNGELIIKNNQNKIHDLTQTTTYYRWNGIQLKKMKSIIVKKNHG